MANKQVAIMCGGDWADASVEIVALPESVDLKAAEKEYDVWRKENNWQSFVDWLRKYKGAVDSNVEEYWQE